LPPMKIHCAQLVEGALRSALTGSSVATPPPRVPAGPINRTLLESFSTPKEGVKIVFLEGDSDPKKA
jgi:nitrogen fixation NifU-like protein